MGLKDAAAKNFFGRRDVMASILNYLFHGGENVIQESQLRDVNESYYHIVQLPDGSFKTDNRFRDKLFEFDNGNKMYSVGLELQSHDDTRMVLRIMEYDIDRYSQLNATHSMHKIMNIVISFDKSKRKPPSKLSEMLPQDDDVPDAFFFDYGYTYLNIYDLAEKIDMFTCRELRDVLYLFKLENDGGHFEEALNDKRFRGLLSRDAVLVCAIFLGMKIRIDNDKEAFSMCRFMKEVEKKGFNEGKAVGRTQGFKSGHRQGFRQGRDEGLRQGRDEGLKEGEANTVKRIVIMQLQNGYDMPEISKVTGASLKDVRKIAKSIQ